MEFDFLEPVDDTLIAYVNNLTSQHFGVKIAFHTMSEFPKLDNVKIAIIGVLENRGNKNSNNIVNLYYIRKELYSLFPGNWDKNVADLGDIIAGNSTDDTYFALQQIVASLIKMKIIPIVIGGSQDLTYAMYRAYDNLEQMVNLVAIDSKFDLGNQEGTITSDAYLSRIIIEQPNNLFNFSNIGYQTYFNSQEEIDLIEKLFFDAYRLGEVSKNTAIAEPVFRDADIVSIDMTAVKSSDSNNFEVFSPNGFNGKEICSLSRYAGISDKVSSFGIFNHNNSKNESILIAQIIWYFLEGVNYRSNEYPFGTKNNYIKYIVPFEKEEIIFYKSNKTDRWWIEVPFFLDSNNKLKKNTLLPCTNDDYLAACNQEFPERWWKAQKKSIY
jgi:arginase family enzyme